MYKTISYTRTVCFLLTLLLFVSLAACGKSPTVQQTEPVIFLSSHPHQKLTATKAVCSIDTTSKIISIPQIGLEMVLLREATSQAVALQDHIYGQVYLLADERYGTSGITVADHYLVVLVGDQIIAKDLLTYEGQFDLEASMEVCDLDADGDLEILVQQKDAMSGGYGHYISRVFDFKDGQIVEISSSENLSEHRQNKFGFTATLMENSQFRVDNEITGYSEVFPLHSGAADYFSASGANKKIDLEIDSFFEFEPKDEDGDGVFTIHCKQYTWYASHADGLGIAETVWKYTPESAAFHMIRAGFVPFT